MSHVSLNSNTGPLRKLIRNFSHGLHNFELAQHHDKIVAAKLNTFYLLKNGDVVSHREWHQTGRPRYIVCGSREGCEGTRDRYKLNKLF